MCVAHLFDGPLVCCNDDPEPHTHVYGSSWLPDRHDSYDPEADR